MSNIYDFDIILKTECNLQHFTRSCRIKNLDDFERDDFESVFLENRTFKCEGEMNDTCYIMKRCLAIFLRGGKVNVAQYS